MRDVELKKALRPDNSLNLKVTTSSGKELDLSLCPSQSVQHLKEKVFGDNPKDGVNFKLLSINLNRILDEKRTLEEEGVKDNDELLLVKRRKERKSASDDAAKVKGPDALKIHKLTEASSGDVKGNKVTDFGAAAALQFDFNRELQRILITLIDAAQLVQFDNETSDDDNGENIEGKNEIDSVSVNQDDLKKLTDMGFLEARAIKALHFNRKTGVEQAMEWLLEHESDKDIDEPLPKRQQPEPAKPRKRKEVIPNRKGVKNLKDMGFAEEDVIKALKATGNNQRAACDWLLGERHDSVEDLDSGLDAESPLYAAIMNCPAVQLSLTNPRILAAFQEMLENPSANGHYITDPETGPVLLQISRIVQGFAR